MNTHSVAIRNHMVYAYMMGYHELPKMTITVLNHPSMSRQSKFARKGASLLWKKHADLSIRGYQKCDG
jgi:hypothetical protein